MKLLKIIFKIYLLSAMFMLTYRRILPAVLIYAAVVFALQLATNATQNIYLLKIADIFASLHLCRKTDNSVVYKNPLNLIRPIVKWFLSDHVLPKKVRDYFDDIREEVREESFDAASANTAADTVEEEQ